MSTKAFGLMETIIAMAIILIISATTITTVLQSFSATRLGDEKTESVLYAQEGVEAVRSIRNQGWTTPFLATDCSLGCGLTTGSGYWEFSGTNNTLGKFTRQITVSPVERDGNGDVVESGGTDDPDTKKVTSTVSWDFTTARSNTTTLVTYLTNFVKTIASGVCEWASAQIGGTFDITSGVTGVKVSSDETYAYVVTDNSGTNFHVFDTSTPASISEEGTATLTTTLTNIIVDGSYAYVTSTSNNDELIIIDISSPTAPNQVGMINLTGRNDALGVYVSGNTAFVVKAYDKKEHEFFVVNITNKSSPQLLGSTDLGGSNANEVFVIGNYAYVASDDDGGEVKVVDISNLSSPNYLSGSDYDISGGEDANTIWGFGADTLVVGATDSNVHFLDISTPTSISSTSTFSTSASVNDVHVDETNEVAFYVADINASYEFEAIDISTIGTPSSIGGVDTSNDFKGLYYNGTTCEIYVSATSSAAEFVLILP